ncbi:MAG: hypothetical protein OEQ39_23755, partial [Gammaproteobacteria bacterium]|nr:hypothetical protein [Gammaproteobacteria bacterium]
MDTRILATGLACLLLYFCLSTPPARALDAIPLYEPAPIGAMLRNLNPTAGVSSPSALNEYGDTVGRVIIDNQYHAFVYTEPHGVALLPMLPDWTSAVAVDITDPLDITGCDPQACVLIVGAAQSSIYGDPERALLWVYDVFNGRVVETVNVGVLPGTDRSTLNAVNNHGIAVGYSRGVLTPQQPMAYDFNTRRLSSLTDFPSNPVDINNDNWIVGGTFRSELAVDSSGFVTVGPVEDLRTSESPSVSQTTALNDLVSDPVEPGVKPDVIGVTPMGYHDGAGRMVIGAVRTVRDAVGVGWEVLWANSAFDRANDINLHRDVVGSLGVSSAIRPFLYIESLGQGFLLNDLIDPDSPYADVSADYGAYAVNDGGWVAAGASGAVLFKRIGNMLPPTPPANLSAVPHEPTWQQPWNAITLNWENTSGLTRHYTIERSVSGENSWSVIKSNWV